MQGLHPRRQFRRVRRLVGTRWGDAVDAVRARLPDGSTTAVKDWHPAPAPGADQRSALPEAADDLRPKATLRAIRWSQSGDLEISGWAYLPGHDVDHAHSSLTLWAEDDKGRWIEATVTRGSRPIVDAVVQNSQHDYAAGWFDAVFSADSWAALIKRDDFAEHWSTIRLRYTDHDQVSVGGFRLRNIAGSPGSLTSYGFADGMFVRPVWKADDGGLRILVARRSVIASARFQDQELSFDVTARGNFRPRRLRLAPAVDRPGPEFELKRARRRHLTARIPYDRLAEVLPGDGFGYPLAVDHEGHVRHIHWAGVQVGAELYEPGAAAISKIRLQARPVGIWRLARQDPAAVLDRVELDTQQNALQVAGRLWADATFDTVELVGDRETWTGPLKINPDGRFSAVVPLIGDDRWGHVGLAPLGGDYLVRLTGPDRISLTPEVSLPLVAELTTEQLSTMIKCRLARRPEGDLLVSFSGPHAADETGRRAKVRLREWNRTLQLPLEDAVYFESFGGKYASCSPRAIFERMAELELPYQVYWGIRDFSVAVPAGAVPVLMHTREWYRIRRRSRYLITNSWMQPTFDKQPGQQVVQTWHGTPYKMLALDRPSAEHRPGFRQAIRNESAKWDYLVAQSDYHASAMASAYQHHGTVIRSGYPRNDIVNRAEGEAVRSRLRTLLGIRDDQRAVLYAPTWREDLNVMVADLDLARLREALGDEWVVLARGHGNMLRRDHDHSAPGVIDVTSYPRAEHLFLASDVGITDYSSIMFDYASSGKPLLFFVPDLERYVGTLRGVYFDLAETAPGPLLVSTDEVVETLRNLDQVVVDHADGYAGWRQRYVPWDDGHAADRVVEAVFGSPGQ
ncbi:MAG TPA: CDP-glycerol glycerophosphotransferase family protein [Microlunatus sp.]